MAQKSTPPKIFPDTPALRRYLNAQHRLGRSWRVLQKEEFPACAFGTLQRIATDPDYEIKHREKRDALRLAPACETCGQVIHKKHHHVPKIPKKIPAWKKWFGKLSSYRQRKIVYPAYKEQKIRSH